MSHLCAQRYEEDMRSIIASLASSHKRYDGRIVSQINFKHFLEQGFLHYLFSSSIERTCSISDLELVKALIMFLNYLITLHAHFNTPSACSEVF